jgi:uncharacterized membrane protein YphA (DoxX/SURF4 family)
MNERSVRERLLHVSPLVLRLGVAAALAFHGVQQVNGLVDGAAGQHALADATGVNVSAAWHTVLGIAELCVAGLLTLGLFTRLATLPVLAGVVLVSPLLAGSTESNISGLGEAGLGEPSSLALMLLAATCLSLLISGCGCLGLDCRLFRRSAKRATEQA